MLEDYEPDIANLAEKLYEAGDDPERAMARAWAIAEFLFDVGVIN